MSSSKNDEIDLVEVLLSGIRIIRDNFWLIISFFVMGTLLGFIYYSTSKKIFENRMLISSEILTESYAKRLIEDVNHVVFERNYKLLTQQLGIKEETAKEIGSIRIQSPLTNETEIAKESERKFFHIIVDVYDQKILTELQNGLLSCIENNEFVKKRVIQKKDFLAKSISKLEQEINDLELFRSEVHNGNFFKKASGNVNFDPTTINSKIIELSKEKVKAQHDLELANSVHLVEGFTKVQNPSKPKLSLSLIAGSLVGLFFVGALIVFKSTRKLLEMAAKES